MRTWVGIVLSTAFFMGTPTAYAGDRFQYRDPATGCDLLVGRADEIPRKSRDGARLLGATEWAARYAAAAACVQRARVGLAAGGALGSEVGPKPIEARLVRSSGRHLTESELADLKRLASLASPRIGVYVLAALAALVAWIAVMVAAFREDHLGWAMLMLFLSAPMAFVYLFTTLGKGHSRFKAACALGMLSPLLVFLARTWLAMGGAPG